MTSRTSSPIRRSVLPPLRDGSGVFRSSGSGCTADGRHGRQASPRSIVDDMRLPELAARLGAELVLPEDVDNASAIDIIGVAAHAHASERHLVFAESEATLTSARASGAGAIVTCDKLAGNCRESSMLLVGQPKLAFARAAELLNAQKGEPGIHASAEIAVTASLGEGVFVGPSVVIGEGAVIGAYSRLDAGTVIGAA